MQRSPLAVVYVTVFVDLLGFGIILPLLPYYAERFGATGLWVGALLTAYSAAQLVGAPLLGRISDRVGRRPVLLLSLAGSSLSLAFTGFADSLLLLLLGRALAGLFGGSIATAQAYIADVTTPEQRTRAMGLLGACIGLGFVFGPALGAGLSRFGFGTAAFAAAALAGVNFFFALARLPESRHPGSPDRRPGLTPARLGHALRRPALASVLGASFLSTFAFVGMEATFALFGARRFGLDAAGLGLVFTFVGVLVVIVQGGLVGRLSTRLGDRPLASAGAIAVGASLLLLPLAPSLLAALPALAGLAVGQALVSPTLSSLLSRESPPEDLGATLGVGQGLAALARAIGPIAAGALFDLGVSVPYLLGGGLALLAAVLVLRGAGAGTVPTHGRLREAS